MSITHYLLAASERYFGVVWSQRFISATGKGQLNASQGGRSLKRAYPYKVKSAAASQLQTEVLQDISKQGQGNANMACCQAATIGLAALSTMGVPSILLSRGGDRAVAAEPPAIDLSQKEATGTLASQQANFASVAKTPKGLLLEKLTREYVEDASEAENPNPSETVLLVGKQQENPSFNSIIQKESKAQITRATMPYQLSGGLANKPLKLGIETNSESLRQPSSEVSALQGFQKKLKTETALEPEAKKPKVTDWAMGSSPEAEEQSMAEWRYEESESSSKSWERIGEQSWAKTFSEESYSQGADKVRDKGSAQLEVQLDNSAIVNTPTEAIAELSQITTRVEGAVVIDSESTQASVSTVYEVRLGDTLAAIATRHGVSVEDLVELNHLRDPNWLEVSQTLKIPQKSSFTLGKKTSIKVEPATIAKTRNESKDYGFTLPTSQGPQITDASYSLSAKGSAGQVTLASWPRQGGEYLAVETKESTVDANGTDVIEPEEVGENNPRNLRPTSTQTLEEDASEISRDSGNNSYSQRLRAEILRLRQQYEFEQESQETTSDRDLEEWEPSLNDSSGDENTLAPDNSRGRSLFRQPEINSPDNRGVLERMSPRRQEIHRLELFPREEPMPPAEEPSLVGANSDKAQEILNSSVGEMVTPELPPLEGADTYLPGGGGSMQFSGYIWPAKGTLTSGYGWRWGRMHQGVDIAAPTGTPIMAAAPGVVSFAGWNSGYGYLVEIKHPDESLTLYAHNSQILVQEGQTVGQGELIAKMGSTGRSTGPHLHFEIHPTGNGAVNPIAYLPSTQALR